MAAKKCVICGKEFDARGGRASAKTCSFECGRQNAREVDRRYEKKNLEKRRESQRKRREKNPEQHRESVRKWQKKNPEKFREMRRRSGRKYRKKHPEKFREKNRKWHDKNPEKCRERYRQRYKNLKLLQQQLDLLSIKGFLESCLPPQK